MNLYILNIHYEMNIYNLNFVINRYAITKSVIAARRANRISQMDKVTVRGTFEYVSSLSCAYAKRGKKKV